MRLKPNRNPEESLEKSCQGKLLKKYWGGACKGSFQSVNTKAGSIVRQESVQARGAEHPT